MIYDNCATDNSSCAIIQRRGFERSSFRGLQGTICFPMMCAK
ncbi:hypothetical protein KSS87_012428 [Heliosperma pusillum]|nr:hypothetical protein KSS87_012428 [Heliosperma pusillum]